nr:unnamed protein product [Callosobruchus chinensis]
MFKWRRSFGRPYVRTFVGLSSRCTRRDAPVSSSSFFFLPGCQSVVHRLLWNFFNCDHDLSPAVQTCRARPPSSGGNRNGGKQSEA